MGDHALAFFVMVFSIIVALVIYSRHFLSFLMLMEIFSICCILGLTFFGPPAWGHVASVILVMSASEGALGLAIMVRMYRSSGNDRVSLVSLVSVGFE